MFTIEGQLNPNTPNHISPDNKFLLFTNNHKVCVMNKEDLQIHTICESKAQSINPFWINNPINNKDYKIIFNLNNDTSSVFDVFPTKLVKDIKYPVLNVLNHRVAFVDNHSLYPYLAIKMLNDILLNKNPSARFEHSGIEILKILFLTRNKFIVHMKLANCEQLIFQSKSIKYLLFESSINSSISNVIKLTPNKIAFDVDNAIRFYRLISKKTTDYLPGYTILNTIPYNITNSKHILLYNPRQNMIVRTLFNKRKPIERIFCDKKVITASYDTTGNSIHFSCNNNKIHITNTITHRDIFDSIIYEGLTEL